MAVFYIDRQKQLIWKQIEASYSQKHYSEADDWCLVALHEVLDRSGLLNIGKLQRFQHKIIFSYLETNTKSRKRMLCALATSDFSEARSIWAQMDLVVQEAVETRFLLYKVGIRMQDSNLVYECLEAISKSSKKDATILYACVLEAQKIGQRDLAIATIQVVLNKYKYGAPPGIHVPALLRCTTRLLISTLEAGSSLECKRNAVKSLDRTFQEAANIANTMQMEATSQFSVEELDWFSRCSYNLSLQFCVEYQPTEILGLIQACLKFMKLLHVQDKDSVTLTNLQQRRLTIEFIASSLFTLLARGEETKDQQLQYYLSVRNHANSFNSTFQAHSAGMEETVKSDFRRKASALLAYKFEATVHLKAWEEAQRLAKAGVPINYNGQCA